jgi:hypothetical protein
MSLRRQREGRLVFSSAVISSFLPGESVALGGAPVCDVRPLSVVDVCGRRSRMPAGWPSSKGERWCGRRCVEVESYRSVA